MLLCVKEGLGELHKVSEAVEDGNMYTGSLGIDWRDAGRPQNVQRVRPTEVTEHVILHAN